MLNAQPSMINSNSASNGELVAHLSWNPDRSTALGIYWTPQGPSVRQDLRVAIAAHFGETLKCQPRGFAHPGTQHHFIAERGWSLVIDLVPQDHPTNAFLRARAGDSLPVSSRNLLDPSQVYNVVDVILSVDIARQDVNDHFKTRRRHQKFRRRWNANSKTTWTLINLCEIDA
jgi:hypothetical protein